MYNAPRGLADREGFVEKVGLELDIGLGQEGREQATHRGWLRERHRNRNVRGMLGRKSRLI